MEADKFIITVTVVVEGPADALEVLNNMKKMEGVLSAEVTQESKRQEPSTATLAEVAYYQSTWKKALIVSLNIIAMFLIICIFGLSFWWLLFLLLPLGAVTSDRY